MLKTGVIQEANQPAQTCLPHEHLKSMIGRAEIIGAYFVGGAGGIVIDRSGDVWFANVSASNTITELVGVAKGPQFFPCSYFTDTSCPQFQGGGNW